MNTQTTPKTYGYARVSTSDQNLDRQIFQLTSYGCEPQNIFSEKESGKNTKRPELSKLLTQLRSGDTLVIWELSRLGRSVTDLITIIDALKEKDVNFICLKDKIDTSSAMGKFIFHMFSALAQFERELISERTIEGLNRAKEQGRVGGRRPYKLDAETIMNIKYAFEADKMTIIELANYYGISRQHIYNVIKGH